MTVSTSVITKAGLTAWLAASAPGSAVGFRIAQFKVTTTVMTPTGDEVALPTVDYVVPNAKVAYSTRGGDTMVFRIALDDPSLALSAVGSVGVFLTDGTLFAIAAFPGAGAKLSTAGAPAVLANAKDLYVIVPLQDGSGTVEVAVDILRDVTSGSGANAAVVAGRNAQATAADAVTLGGNGAVADVAGAVALSGGYFVAPGDGQAYLASGVVRTTGAETATVLFDGALPTMSANSAWRVRVEVLAQSEDGAYRDSFDATVLASRPPTGDASSVAVGTPQSSVPGSPPGGYPAWAVAVTVSASGALTVSATGAGASRPARFVALASIIGIRL